MSGDLISTMRLFCTARIASQPDRCLIFSGTTFIRRECVDHFVVLGGVHLRRVLQAYARYYNDIRTHLSFPKIPSGLDSHRKAESSHS